MSIDPVIQQSIIDMCEECDQNEQVAKLIANWYEQVIVGNESVTGDSVANRQNAFTHLEHIFDAMWSPHNGGESE